MKKIHWIRIWQRLKPKWTLNRFGKQKALLAFEFGIVLSAAAKDLNIEMRTEIVVQAEKLLENELGKESAESFAHRMHLYALAVLEPKD